MTSAQLFAVATVLGVWTTVAAVCIGVGLLGRRWDAAARLSLDSLLRAFWFGLAIVVAIAQVWHFFLPINLLLVILLAGAGAAGWTVNLRHVPDLVPRSNTSWLGVLTVALFTLWAALLAIGAPLYFDAGLYHLPTVQWLVSHSIVPGLGNLHDRLAFNNSSLLVTALLEVALPNQSQHFASGVFVLPMAALIAGRAVGFWSEGPERRAANALPLLLMTPLVGLVASPLISATSTDVPANFAVMFGMVWLFDLLSDRTHDQRWRSRTDLLIVTVFTLGAVFKVSHVVIGAAGSALALFAANSGAMVRSTWWPRVWNRTNLTACVLAAMLMIPWMARGVITSGYPVYPITVGAFPVDWRIPEEQARIVQRLAITDARLARHVTDITSPLLDGFRWVPIWLRNQFAGVQIGMTVLPALIALGAFGAIVAARLLIRTPRRIELTGHEILAYVPIVVAMLAWFFTIPAPRFGTCLFWPLAALSGAVFVGACAAHASRPTLAVLIGAAIMLGTTPIAGVIVLTRLGGIRGVPLLIPPNTEMGLYPPPNPELTVFRTRGGLPLHTLFRDPRAWNAPLPNTPFPSPRISLRDPARVASGFAYDRTPSARPPVAAMAEVREFLHAQAKPGDVVYADDAARLFLMQSPIPNAQFVPPARWSGEPPRTLEDHLIGIGQLRGKPRAWVVFADGPESGSFDVQQPLLYLLDWMGPRAGSFHARDGGASLYLYLLPKPEGTEH